MTETRSPEPADTAATRLARDIRERRHQAGLSQPQLAKRIGYTRQYVSLAERIGHNLPSLDVVKAIDQALNADGALIALREQAKREQGDLRRTSSARPPTGDAWQAEAGIAGGVLGSREAVGGGASVPRRAPERLPVPVEPPRLVSRPGGVRYAAALVEALHRDYQAARYAEATDALPGVLETVTIFATDGTGDQRREALTLRCQTAVVAAKVATKFGDGVTAYEAAEQARLAGEEAEDIFGQASAAYQLTCALLRLGGAPEAERNAIDFAEDISGDNPESCTWRGALMLISAIIAARRDDFGEAQRRLDHAERLAAQLGRDDNIGFTAFGPTNVRIHRVAAAVCAGDPRRVLAEAEPVDITALPAGLHGRQGQFHLDTAWAHTQLGDDPLAVIHLLESERVAPQLVRTHRTARTLVRDLMAREHRRTTPGLRALAHRIGVTA